MHIDSPGFARKAWQRLRRPSTLVLIGAGLLAADRLRWLPAAWTDATLFAAAGLALALGMVWLLMLQRRRPRHHREVQVVVLPLRNRDRQS